MLFGLVFAMLAGIAGADGMTSVLFVGSAGYGINDSADNWFSPYPSTWLDMINISINITGEPITADISDVNATVANAQNGTVYGVYTMTNYSQANASEWNLTLNLSDVIWANETIIYPVNITITINATNSTGDGYLETGASNQTITIVAHDLGKVQGPPANATGPGGINASICMQEGSGTTNMSAIADFNATNFVMVIDLNGSASCNPSGAGALPWGSTYQSMAMFNFTSVDMSTQAKAQAVMSAMGSSIQVQIAPPRSYGTTRIYVNSSAVTALNTTATVTLYNLPFSALPNITYDEGFSNGVSWNWSQGGWNATMGTMIGNLTIGIGNFSGYNISDVIEPTITITQPSNGTNYSLAYINITVNGTGTDVQNITLEVFQDDKWWINGKYLYNQSVGGTSNSINCTNSSYPGLDMIQCELANVTVPARPGNITLRITAYDYGGTAGNSYTETSWFMNNTAPYISNITITNTTGHTAIAAVTITDANGWQDIGAYNLTAIINNTANFTCSQLSNTTTTYTMTVQFSCTNATEFNFTVSTEQFSLNITVNDTFNNSVRSNTTTGIILPNYAPSSTTPTLSSSILYEYMNLTCTAGNTDADSDPLGYRFVWYINGTIPEDGGTTSNGSAINFTLDAANFTNGSTVICQVYANDNVTNASSAVNSTTLTVLTATYTNFTDVDTDNITTADLVLDYNTSTGAFLANVSIPSGVTITSPETAGVRYSPGIVSITEATAPTTGDLSGANALGVNVIFGPEYKNFSSNVTVVINYSGSSRAAQIETALTTGNLTVKKCRDDGSSCQDLLPQSYDTSTDLITINISGFSMIGLYDSTPAPVPGYYTTTGGSSSGGGAYTGAVAPSCTPSWKCTDWSSCKLTGESTTEGERTRDCTDLNKCGVSTNKPSESATCTIGSDEMPPEETPTVTPPEEVPPTQTGQQTGAQGTTPTITPPAGTTGTGEEPQPTDWTLIIGAIVVVVIIGVVGLGVIGGGGALYFLKKPKGLKGV
ncbi:hypothetical protein COU37_04215 [Candidatus Micrarchaeota archaeon CG10_big_fil_rev_8_21_14_0_10_45_29]|nr:MAG: hypothetical protein COU37_04215 [Candidatus Micrarchaeota archaeon CG10_big_fil_rev_8_21_14_0_10_45_29]